MRSESIMQPLIAYEDVNIVYGKNHAAKDISFSLHRGQTLCIVGESGSGKSTLLKAAMNILGDGAKCSGHIYFDGADLLDLTAVQMQYLYGRHIGMIFQAAGDSLCPVRSIGAQIAECMAVHFKLTKNEAEQKALTLFEKFGLNGARRIWRSCPFELSGGMNQRVALAMAMLMQPELLLADEPTSALDVCAQKAVLDEIKMMRSLNNTAVILITHDISVAAYMADYIMVMQNGRIAEYAASSQILHAPKSAYTKRLLAAAPKLRR